MTDLTMLSAEILHSVVDTERERMWVEGIVAELELAPALPGRTKRIHDKLQSRQAIYGSRF